MNGRCIIVAGLCAAVPCLACAPVPGEGRFVHIASEEALIIWDDGAKREHFIRRASFDTNAKDFGFLVPTPTQPELGESDDAAFDLLARITAPAVVRSGEAGAKARIAAAAAPEAVTVLEQTRVAGLDAAVLEASDADALDGWLKRNGYPSSPELVEWYAPYIAAKWKITAFKIASGTAKVSTAAVRMSFQAERPFFPYREPATQRVPDKRSRLLRVYFIADGQMAGVLGEKAAWSGQPVWSKKLQEGELAKLLKTARLPSMAGGGARWLTEFEDRASPRPRTDEVFFHRAASDTTIERQPQFVYYDWREYWVPAAASGFLLMICALAFWVWREAGKGNG